MYPPELEIKDTTESNTSASYLDLLLSIGRDGQLHIVSIVHLQRVRHANKRRLLLRTPGPVPLWDLQMFYF